MHTKTFLLLAFSLIGLSSFANNSNKKSESNFLNNDIHSMEIVVPTGSQSPDKNADSTDSKMKHKESKGHHPDEDGKHLVIHFNRLKRRKKKSCSLLVVAKMVLIVMHLSLLLYGFVLLTHSAF